MSVRKEGDQREFVDGLDGWQRLVDRKIREAQEQGDFDDLPGFGKPLQLHENPFEGDMAMAYHLLRNAGASPPWIEMQEEVRRASEELRALLARLERGLRQQHRAIAQGPARERPTVAQLARELAQARALYLQRAAAVNRLIARYNAALPPHLSWLEKAPLPPRLAAEQFDSVCPPLTRRPPADQTVALY